MTPLNVNGVEVPGFLYGTAWKEERTEGLVLQALEAGFRGIDTANQRKHYFEAGVGAALAKAGVPRSELFLQTKFTHQPGQDERLPYDPSAPVGEQVLQSFESSLEHLGVDALDSYVLHGPSQYPGLGHADWEAWRAMEALQAAGRTKLIGVSNVSPDQLEELVLGARVKPAFVQNRCYARWGWDALVRAICDREGLVYQGFSLLTANPQVLVGPARAIAARRGLGVAPVVFRFAMQLGMLPLTGTTDPDHMRLDLTAFDFALDGDEMAALGG